MIEIEFDHVDGLCKKKKYQVEIQKADSNKVYNVPDSPGEIYNLFEEVTYHVEEGEFVITGTAGEMWVISKNHLERTYDIHINDIGDIPIKVWTKSSDVEYEFMRVEPRYQGIVNISIDRVLVVNSDKVDHGKGDVLIRSINSNDFWSVNGIIFENTFDIL